MRRALAYLRGLYLRATRGPICPGCGEPAPTREDWLLHLGLEHPVWAEAYRGTLNPITLWRWVETDADGPSRSLGDATREERRAWLHKVARSIYGGRYPA